MIRLLLACLAMGSVWAAAENTTVSSVTLKDALRTAEERSPRVQIAESARNESYWRTVENRSVFLPTLTANAQYLSDYKYVFTDINLNGNAVSFPGITPTTIYGLTAEYDLFDGFAGTNRWRSGSAFERASSRELDWAKFETECNVTLLFYRALAARSLRGVTEANLKTLEDHLHDVALLKRSGMSTNYDVLRVEVQVSEARSELLNASDDIETASGRLAESLGLDNVPETKGVLPELPPELIDRLGPAARRPDLAAMQERVEALRQQKLAATAHWAPRVNLFGNYQYYNNRNDEFDDWKNFRNAYQIGVRLTWSLFEGGAAEARNREAIEKKVQNEKALRMAELKAAQDVALWKRKYHYFYSVYKSRQSDIGKAKESVRLAKEGRRVGSRTNSDLLDAETDLNRAQAGAIHAQLGVIEALINLELATGQSLYEFN